MAQSESSQFRLDFSARDLFAGLALVALAVGVLIPAFRGGFLWGDDGTLTQSWAIQGPDGWWRLWFAPGTADYFPLTATTFWLQWRLWQMEPMGYHVTNVLLHGAVVLLTWLTLRRLRVPGAWIAAAIFAVHPVCVDSVAWLTERGNLLSQIFLLLSIICFAGFEEEGTLWRYAAAFVCFTLALLAKPTVLMLPFILLLLAWWRSRDREPKRSMSELVVWMIPFFAVALVLGLVAIYFQNTRAIAGAVIPNGNVLQRAISAGFAAGFYLYSALWPFDLSPVYPEWHRAFATLEKLPTAHMSPPSPDAIPYWKQAIPGVLIVGLLFYCWMRRGEVWARAVLTGLGCYLIALLPVLGLVTMALMRVTLLADHFQYISIVAVIALLVAGGYQRAFRPAWLVVASAVFGLIAYWNWGQTKACHLQEIVWIAAPLVLAFIPAGNERIWKWGWSGVLGLVLVCFVPITWGMAGNYRDEETYWTAVLAKNPNCWQACNHLGSVFYMRGDFHGAFSLFLKAAQLNPENPESHNNLGLAYSRFSMNEPAIKEYQSALAIKDDSAMCTNLANAYEEAGRYPEAIGEYKHAVQLSPENASAWCNMGYTLMRMGKIDDAIPCFMKVIEIDPGMPQGRSNLKQALRMLGIDPDAPAQKGSYPFDLEAALRLVKTTPKM
jgi:tetratricopeptide (TPR) repeat protein